MSDLERTLCILSALFPLIWTLPTAVYCLERSFGPTHWFDTYPRCDCTVVCLVQEPTLQLTSGRLSVQSGTDKACHMNTLPCERNFEPVHRGETQRGLCPVGPHPRFVGFHQPWARMFTKRQSGRSGVDFGFKVNLTTGWARFVDETCSQMSGAPPPLPLGGPS